MIVVIYLLVLVDRPRALRLMLGDHSKVDLE